MQENKESSTKDTSSENKSKKVPCIEMYTDGGSRGNPGPSAIGVILIDGDKEAGDIKHLEESGALIGRKTNSQAEYSALIQGLQLCMKYNPDMVFVTSDSEFMIKQMTGEYKVRSGSIRSQYLIARNLSAKFKQVNYQHVNRDHPIIARCDALVNEALDNQRVLPFRSTNGLSVSRETSLPVEIVSELDIARGTIDRMYEKIRRLKKIEADLPSNRRGGIANQINRMSERIAVAEFNYKQMTV